MSDIACKFCGKSLVVAADPKNPARLNTMLAHYIDGEVLVCIECHNGKGGPKVKEITG